MRSIHKMNLRLILFCVIVIGTAVWLHVTQQLFLSDFSEVTMIQCATSRNASHLLVYNKTCGVQYWNRRRNFGNKEDVLFFPIMSHGLMPIKGEIIIIEFGANTGQFSQAVFNTTHEVPFAVHSLEPVVELLDLLKNQSLNLKKRQNDKHFYYNIAISDRSGWLPIYSTKEASECATLGQGSKLNFVKVADVVVTTLPAFIKKYHIKTPISFIRIDVEGFEPEVVLGMDLKMNAHKFPLFSFETGGTWRDDRSVLARNVTMKSFITILDNYGYDSFFIGYPYLLPISGTNWDDAFEDFTRASNVLCVLRCSKHGENLLKSLQNISLDSCQWQ